MPINHKNHEVILAQPEVEQLNIARQLNEEGRYDESMEICKQVVPLLQASESWEQYVLSLTLWCSNLIALSKWQDSFEKAQEALDKALKYAGEQHLCTGDAYHVIGKASLKNNRQKEAIAFIQKSLAIKEAILGETHQEVLNDRDLIGLILIEQNDYDQAIALFNKNIDIRLLTLGEVHRDIATSHKNLGLAFYYKGDFESSLFHCQKSLDISVQTMGELHHFTAIGYNNVGNIYWYKGNYNKAISYCKKALDIQLQIVGEMDSNTADSFHNIGNAYYSKGDFDRAISYCEKGLQIRLQILGEFNRATAVSYHNLGASYWSKKLFDQAVQFYEKSLQIRLKLFGELHPDTASSYQNLGSVYETQHNYTQAIEYGNKSLSIRLKTIGEIHPDTASSYLNIGISQQALGNTQEAIENYQKSLNIWLQTFGKIHPATAKNYLSLGKVYKELGNYGQAMEYYQQALQSLVRHYSEDSPYIQFVLQNYSSPSWLLTALQEKAAILYLIYQTQSQQPLDLLAAWHTCSLASQLLDIMRQSYRAEGSKLTLAQNAQKVHTQAIDLCWEVAQHLPSYSLDDAYLRLQQLNPEHNVPMPEKAFHYAFRCSEKSKAVVLLGNLKDKEARFAAGIPPHLLEQEYNLRIETNYLEKQIAEEECKNKEKQREELLATWKTRFFECKQQYDALVEQFEQEFPDYYVLKYQTDTASLTDLQQALPTDTYLIEYFVSERFIYLFAIGKNDFKVLQIDKSPDFEEDVKDYLYFGIGTTGGPSQTTLREYREFAHQLYQTLLEPLFEAMPIPENSHLIIIPDGILHSLPFETLLTHTGPPNPDYPVLPYLLLDYHVSYHLSATLWLHQERKKQNKVSSNLKGFLGLAPVYSVNESVKQHRTVEEVLADIENRHHLSQTDGAVNPADNQLNHSDWKTLPFSEIEVRVIEDLFAAKGLTAKTYLHQAATASNFKTAAQHYQYLHIAAHGDFNEAHPELTAIIFSPDEATNSDPLFYMSDAYNLQLNADLVVLSCCDSGVGKEVTGEGVMAMNRGFLYAGAQNVIYTLFKVADQESSQLTQYLFTQILQNKPPLQALRQAKLEMIKTGYLPVYWSGYVLLGN